MSGYRRQERYNSSYNPSSSGYQSNSGGYEMISGSYQSNSKNSVLNRTVSNSGRLERWAEVNAAIERSQENKSSSGNNWNTSRRTWNSQVYYGKNSQIQNPPNLPLNLYNSRNESQKASNSINKYAVRDAQEETREREEKEQRVAERQLFGEQQEKRSQEIKDKLTRDFREQREQQVFTNPKRRKLNVMGDWGEPPVLEEGGDDDWGAPPAAMELPNIHGWGDEPNTGNNGNDGWMGMIDGNDHDGWGWTAPPTVAEGNDDWGAPPIAIDLPDVGGWGDEPDGPTAEDASQIGAEVDDWGVLPPNTPPPPKSETPPAPPKVSVPYSIKKADQKKTSSVEPSMKMPISPRGLPPSSKSDIASPKVAAISSPRTRVPVSPRPAAKTNPSNAKASAMPISPRGEVPPKGAKKESGAVEEAVPNEPVINGPPGKANVPAVAKIATIKKSDPTATSSNPKVASAASPRGAVPSSSRQQDTKTGSMASARGREPASPRQKTVIEKPSENVTPNEITPKAGGNQVVPPTEILSKAGSQKHIPISPRMHVGTSDAAPPGFTKVGNLAIPKVGVDVVMRSSVPMSPRAPPARGSPKNPPPGSPRAIAPISPREKPSNMNLIPAVPVIPKQPSPRLVPAKAAVPTQVAPVAVESFSMPMETMTTMPKGTSMVSKAGKASATAIGTKKDRTLSTMSVTSAATTAGSGSSGGSGLTAASLPTTESTLMAATMTATMSSASSFAAAMMPISDGPPAIECKEIPNAEWIHTLAENCYTARRGLSMREQVKNEMESNFEVISVGTWESNGNKPLFNADEGNDFASLGEHSPSKTIESPNKTEQAPLFVEDVDITIASSSGCTTVQVEEAMHVEEANVETIDDAADERSNRSNKSVDKSVDPDDIENLILEVCFPSLSKREIFTASISVNEILQKDVNLLEGTDYKLRAIPNTKSVAIGFQQRRIAKFIYKFLEKANKEDGRKLEKLSDDLEVRGCGFKELSEEVNESSALDTIKQGIDFLREKDINENWQEPGEEKEEEEKKTEESTTTTKYGNGVYNPSNYSSGKGYSAAKDKSNYNSGQKGSGVYSYDRNSDNRGSRGGYNNDRDHGGGKGDSKRDFKLSKGAGIHRPKGGGSGSFDDTHRAGGKTSYNDNSGGYNPSKGSKGNRGWGK